MQMIGHLALRSQELQGCTSYLFKGFTLNAQSLLGRPLGHVATLLVTSNSIKTVSPIYVGSHLSFPDNTSAVKHEPVRYYNVRPLSRKGFLWIKVIQS